MTTHGWSGHSLPWCGGDGPCGDALVDGRRDIERDKELSLGVGGCGSCPGDRMAAPFLSWSRTPLRPSGALPSWI